MTDVGRSRRGDAARQYLSPPLESPGLQSLVALIAATLSFPTVRVNILDDTDQHTIHLFGPGDQTSVARHQSFCDTVVRAGSPVVVEDAARDPRFADLPAVRNREIGSYLGVPLLSADGVTIGALCVTDTTRRAIDSHLLWLLLQLAKTVQPHLEPPPEPTGDSPTGR